MLLRVGIYRSRTETHQNEIFQSGIVRNFPGQSLMLLAYSSLERSVKFRRFIRARTISYQSATNGSDVCGKRQPVGQIA